MEAREYDRLAAAEDRLWWFRGLHANIVAALAGSAGAPLRILDAGFGTGGLLRRLAAAFETAAVVGIEIDARAAATAAAKSGQHLCVGSVDLLPFADGAFDAIVSADVLCHRGVEQGRAVRGFRRCLRRGGVLVLNLPAYRWLYSAHDRAVDIARRYARAEVQALLDEAGFAGVRTSYWNTFLLPLMVLRRKLRRSVGGRSELSPLPAPIDRAFAAVLALETRLLGAGIPLPFGGSILAVAVKP